MTFEHIAYAKLNLNFDKQSFIKEYDEFVLPRATRVANYQYYTNYTRKLNKIWNMVPDEIYDKGDSIYFENNQKKFHQGTYRAWMKYQMMELDTSDITDLVSLDLHNKDAIVSPVIGIDSLIENNFKLKEECKDSVIANWVLENLPFYKIKSIFCISLEAGSFSVIHRDRNFPNDPTKVVQNLTAKSGILTVNINITNGGVPLLWALDQDDVSSPIKADDDVYITSDHFMHGIPLCTDIRRQIRIKGIPKPEFWTLIDPNAIVELEENYPYNHQLPEHLKADK